MNATPMMTVENRRVAATSLRLLVIGLTAFLTVVDLFATQAILPTLVRTYGVGPALGLSVALSLIALAALMALRQSEEASR